MTTQNEEDWNALTDADRERAFNSLPDMLDGFLKKWGWLHFAQAIEDICREKNPRYVQLSDVAIRDHLERAKLALYLVGNKLQALGLPNDSTALINLNAAEESINAAMSKGS